MKQLIGFIMCGIPALLVILFNVLLLTLPDAFEGIGWVAFPLVSLSSLIYFEVEVWKKSKGTAPYTERLSKVIRNHENLLKRISSLSFPVFLFPLLYYSIASHAPITVDLLILTFVIICIWTLFMLLLIALLDLVESSIKEKENT
mgnify:CR=1 FL=1